MPSGDSRAALLAWPQLVERLGAGSPLVLPVGATEQHGAHLPLATDTLIVEALADAVSAHVGGVSLPALPYGAPSRPRSGGGDLFPMPALPLETLLASVASVAAGALEAGATALVVLSWHWENAAVLWDALRPLFPRDGDARAVLVDNPAEFIDGDARDALFPAGFPGWESEHAGRLETALMMHLAPELVGTAEAPSPHAPRGLDVLPTPADAAPANGVFVDARDVTPEMGARCFESISRNLVAAVTAELAATRPGLSRD
jgi:creatinine amidohydrolase